MKVTRMVPRVTSDPILVWSCECGQEPQQGRHEEEKQSPSSASASSQAELIRRTLNSNVAYMDHRRIKPTKSKNRAHREIWHRLDAAFEVFRAYVRKDRP